MYAVVDGLGKVAYKKDSTIIKLGEEEVEVGSIKGTTEDKLINATDVNGQAIVLDARKGFDHLSLAKSEGRKVVRVEGKSYRIVTQRLFEVPANHDVELAAQPPSLHETTHSI